MKQLDIGQSVDIHETYSSREGRRYFISPVEQRYLRRKSSAIGRVWRLSKNTYRYSNYVSRSRQWTNFIVGKSTTFNSAYNELIRKHNQRV